MWQVLNRDGQWEISETIEARFYTVGTSDLPEVLERLLVATDGSQYSNPRDLLAPWEYESDDWQPGEECLTVEERNR